MQGHLATTDGTTSNPDRDAVRAAASGGEGFWLDLTAMDADAGAVLREDFHFHPLAVEDAEHFGQRPKVEPYDGFVLVVIYGIAADGSALEMHCFVSEHYLVTVRQQQVPGWDALVRRLGRADRFHPAGLLYLIWDHLVDGYFPVLDGIEDEIDTIQDDILRAPSDQQLARLFALKRRLISLRRFATDQRDMAAPLLTHAQALPDMTASVERYYRDIYDHLVRISQTADNARELLSSAVDTHLSMTSTRLNVVMKQLAIIATVFLPLTFLTGFFGQNFGWLVDHIGGAPVFWVVAVGLPVVVALVLLAMFRRMGWLAGRAR